jgi:hypothetical protein
VEDVVTPDDGHGNDTHALVAELGTHSNGPDADAGTDLHGTPRQFGDSVRRRHAGGRLRGAPLRCADSVGPSSASAARSIATLRLTSMVRGSVWR